MRLLSILTVCFLFIQLAKSQTCLESGIRFESQEDINNFPIDYPNCTEILGSVEVFFIGVQAVTLAPLQQITKIDSNLNISCNVVYSLDGLQNIESVGGDVNINASNLLVVDSLKALEKIGGKLAVSGNNINNIIGLQNVDSIGTDIFISSTSMASLDGLDNIDHVYGDLILNVPNVMDFKGLDSLSVVDGDLRMLGLESISTSFVGFNNIDSIGGKLNINGFPMIQTLEPFSNLSSLKSILLQGTGLINLKGLEGIDRLEDGIKLSSNIDLMSLEGLDNLEVVNGLFEIHQNNNLEEVQGLNSINRIESLLFDSNENLQSMLGLESLESINDLRIKQNLSLTSLEGLGGLKIIESGLYLYENLNLKSLDGLSNLDTLNDVLSLSSTGLESLSGLSGLSEINTISIWNNEFLTSLAGMTNLTEVRYIHLRNNDALSSLSGLESITELSQLRIEKNDMLLSLSGIDNVDPISIQDTSSFGTASIIILSNPLLAFCSQSPICEALLRPNTQDSIQFNMVNCNSKDEILSKCTTAVNHTDNQEVVIRPNPVMNELYLEKFNATRVIIYDTFGKIMAEYKISNRADTIDVAHFPAGVYYLQFGGKNTYRFVKI